MVHDRVPDEHDLEDVLAVDAGVVDELADQLVERGPHGGSELALAAGVHHHVRHPAHQVLAEADLGVHPPRARQHLAGREVAQVPGDRGRADVDRDAVDGADVARPHGDDQIGGAVAVAERDRRCSIGAGERPVHVGEHPPVDVGERAPVLLGDGVAQHPGRADGVTELGGATST